MDDYTSNMSYFIDPGIVVKTEPRQHMDTSSPVLGGGTPGMLSLSRSTASVPIPGGAHTRRVALPDLTEYRYLELGAQSPTYQELSLMEQILKSPLGGVTNCVGEVEGDEQMCAGIMHMDDDDIFQVDKADLIQGPTLAELNANDDTLLADLNFDDLLLPEENHSHNRLYLLHQQHNSYDSPVRYNNTVSSGHHHHNNTTSTVTSNSYTNIGQHLSSSGNNNTNSTHFLSGSCPSQSSFASAAYVYHHHHRGDLDSLLLCGKTSPGAGNTPSPSPLAFSPRSDLGGSNSPQLSLYGGLVVSNSPPVSPRGGNSQQLSSIQQKHSTLHELLMKKDAAAAAASVSAASSTNNSPSHHPGNVMTSPQRHHNQLHLNIQPQSQQQTAQSQQQGSKHPHHHATRGSISSTTPVSTTTSQQQQQQAALALSRLSSSAPSTTRHLALEQIWQRREPRKHLLSTGSLAEQGGSTSSLSTTGGILSPEAIDYNSHDDLDLDLDDDTDVEYDDDDDDDSHYEDFSSDNEDDPNNTGHHHHRHRRNSTGTHPSGNSSSVTANTSAGKKERYFWQYNVQAKGPKGARLVLKTRMENPHVLNEVTDPVFSSECAVRGIKHSGKARKGDGNDLTPNPRKLCTIGRELDKLGKVINDMTPVSELPFSVRPKTRKEKNKLASRACRLKKKAQHEANKIKLQGLESEHKRLMSGLSQVKQILAVKVNDGSAVNTDELGNHIEKVWKQCGRIRIAGQTTEYVNKILEKYKGEDGTSMMMENYM